MANHATPRTDSPKNTSPAGPNRNSNPSGPGPGPGRTWDMDDDKSRSPLPPVPPARDNVGNRFGPGTVVRINGQRTGTNSSLAIPRTTTAVVAAATPSLQSRTSRSAEAEVISLTQPRPNGERVGNEYIDTPLKGGLCQNRSSAGSTPLHAETHIHISGSPHDHLALVSPLGSHSHKSSSSKSLALTPSSPSLKRLQSTRRSLPITKQPGAITFTKDSIGVTSHESDIALVAHNEPNSDCSATSAGRDSIICPECGRCRCEACRTPRPLPSRWLCRDKCLCSAEACIDYASCLCCVKGLFYHCASEEDGGSCADRPCSCAPHHRFARWGCLASLSLALPCLACYWPLWGCVKVLELCYQRCTQHGCRCDLVATSSPNRPVGSKVVITQPLPSSGKRLLDTD